MVGGGGAVWHDQKVEGIKLGKKVPNFLLWSFDPESTSLSTTAVWISSVVSKRHPLITDLDFEDKKSHGAMSGK